MVISGLPDDGLRSPHSASGSHVVDRVVFVGPRLPATEGGSTAVMALSDAFDAAGIAVSHISIYPGDRVPSYPTWTVLERETLHRVPVSGGQSAGLRLVGVLPKALFKRLDRRLRLRLLKLRLDRLDSRTAIVFTHVNAKKLVDESGYTRTRGSSDPLLVGQHHSQFSSLADEPALAADIPRHFSDIDAFVALTDADAAGFQSMLPVPSVGIPNPSTPSTTKSAHDAPLAVVLARFSHEKQLPLLVEMFAEATKPAALSDWRLEIYGEGEEEPLIREAIHRSDARDRVRLMGVTRDPDSVYARATINLLASSLEGFGMTIVEAAQVGVPTVAFDCSPGVHDLLSDGAGYLVPAQDRHTYVATLQTCFQHRADRVRTGARARACAQSLDPAVMATRWLSLFTQVRKP